MVFSLAMPAYATTGATPSDTDIVVPLPGPGDYLSSQTQAAVQLRSGMKARQETVVIKVMTTRTDLEAFMEELFYMALEHTGQPTEGDYLHWQIGGYDAEASVVTSGSYNKLTITYTISYYTTAQQEAAVDAAIAEFLGQLNLESATEYDKVKTVYDLICASIVYDNEGLAAGSLLPYTAYGAIIDGRAVCQGYAVLFYRAMLELGIDARVIVGMGDGNGNGEFEAESEAHAWNIVKIGDLYYNVDATWDATLSQAGQPYGYFLKCQAAFADHVREAEYDTEAFHAAYPMAAQNFSEDDYIPGDVDNNGVVDLDDVIALLLYVSMPEVFPITGNADFNASGTIDVDDVLELLLYVSMPDQFPLVAA